MSFKNEKGSVVFCRSCRRVKDHSKTDEWVLVTAWYVEPPADAKMTLCPECEAKDND